MNNPPAFPKPMTLAGDHIVENSNQGMSLRDYFAGQALLADLGSNLVVAQAIASASYLIADAMLAERQKEGRS